MDPDKVKDQDDDLYEPLIWALSIGIIVVIATLFFTRPAPESFTELYFLNHTTLPEYVNQDYKYDYSFVVHNLENKPVEYNYTTTLELYKYDYTCEKPDLYLELKNNTRITDTDDPALLIREDSYNVSFNFELMQENGLGFQIHDINKNPLIDISIDNKAYFQNIPINISNTDNHKFLLSVNPKTMILTIDNNSLTLDTPENYKGFPYIETRPYAYISNFIITRNSTKQNVNIRASDSINKEVTLNKTAEQGIKILYSRYLSSPLYQKLVLDPTIRSTKVNDSITTYYADEINISSFILSTNFKIYTNTKVLLIFDGKLSIEYSDKLVINNREYDSTSRSMNSLVIKYWYNHTEIYFNDKLVTIVDVDLYKTTPKIISYNNAVVRDFSIKAINEPIAINYKIPGRMQTEYSGLLTLSTIQKLRPNTTEQAHEQVQELFQREEIDWTSFNLRANYYDSDKNGTFTISYETINSTIFTFSANAIGQQAYIRYIKNNQLIARNFSIQPLSINRLLVDVDSNTLIFSFNDRFLLKDNIPIVPGVALFEYPGLMLLNAQAENKETNTYRIFKKQTTVDCKPQLINIYSYSDIKTIAYNQFLIYNGYVIYNEDFDIAKVQITLQNGQEIHFWSSRI